MIYPGYYDRVFADGRLYALRDVLLFAKKRMEHCYDEECKASQKISESARLDELEYGERGREYEYHLIPAIKDMIAKEERKP